MFVPVLFGYSAAQLLGSQWTEDGCFLAAGFGPWIDSDIGLSCAVSMNPPWYRGLLSPLGGTNAPQDRVVAHGS